MATLKANGGVFRYLDKPALGDKTAVRLAVCHNGRVLQKFGDTWKRVARVKAGKTLTDAVANLERNGYIVDTSGVALGMRGRTCEDAMWHKRAIKRRRLERSARP